jgi:DNA-binding response OmpR family regulator
MTEFDQVDILLVEDDANDAETTTIALSESKVRNKCFWVRDGQEALEFMSCTGPYAQRDPARMPKVILLDLKMPKVGGLDVLRTLKADERTRSVPVVIMTSSSQESDVAESYDLGANAYVVKPVNFTEFSAVVGQLGMFWLLINKSP